MAHTRTILGFDITSAPSAQKPITCAAGALFVPSANSTDIPRLHIAAIYELTTLQQVAHILGGKTSLPDASPAAAPPAYDEYVAGMDFPFGLPLEFLHASGWPTTWESYVRHIGSLEKSAFERAVYSYMEARPQGKKLCYRETDRQANAQSPIRLTFVPVGKMFFRLAPIIERSEATVFPVKSGSAARSILEAYPALIARAVLGKKPYKEGKPEQRAERRANRLELTSALLALCKAQYGFTLTYAEHAASHPTPKQENATVTLQEKMILDWRGDIIDAVLCALQTARASLLPEFGLSNLPAAARNEGWILETPPGT